MGRLRSQRERTRLAPPQCAATAVLAFSVWLVAAAPALAAHVADWNGDGTIVIGCLGDSNTSNIGIPSWCAKLVPLVSGFGWQVQNYGVPGATVLSPNPLAPSFTSTAAQQLQSALANALPPDVFLLAFGTNDVRGGGAAPDIVAAYAGVKASIEAGGRHAMVALTPQVCATDTVGGVPTNDLIAALNAALSAEFAGADELLDFGTILNLATDYRDCLHMNDAGMTKRAKQAFAQLTPDFYVQNVREVCQFPRQNNNGKVIGHDVGFSVLYNGTSYWFFADTIWDANNDGAHTDGDGFIGTGTIATTTDLTAADGMTMTYRASGGTVQPLFPASALLPDECLLWPQGAVVANDTIYLYTTGKKNVPSCSLGSPSETFLARIDPTTLVPTRLGTIWGTADQKFNWPFKVSEPDGCGGLIKWVYVIGAKNGGFATTGYILGRVPEAQIENPAQYQYWNGTTWVTGNPAAASPLFSEVLGGNHASVVFNTFLDRWMVVHSCGDSVCARTATTTGSLPAALVSGWSPRVTLYQCPGSGLTCYHGFQHAEYGSGATIYVTSARNTPGAVACDSDEDCFCPNDPNPVNQCELSGSSGTCTTPNLQRRYRLRLREIVLGPTPPPAGRTFADAARDYSPKARCDDPVQGLNGWSYQRLSGTTLTDMSYSWLWNWTGPDAVSGFPAPLINEDVAFPGTNTDAVRVWHAPGPGSVRISGEVRKKWSCGDASIAQIVRIQNGVPTGGALWSATLTPAQPSVLLDYSTTVAAGEALGFKVKRGGSGAGCDELFFAPTITHTP